MLKYPILALLRFYKLAISPLLPQACRFTPTCSVYMAEAVRRFGAIRGVWLGVKRLARCHPLGGAGHDPVPDRPPSSVQRPALSGDAAPATTREAPSSPTTEPLPSPER